MGVPLTPSDLYRSAPDAYNPYMYNKVMEKITDYDLKAVEYLDICIE